MQKTLPIKPKTHVFKWAYESGVNVAAALLAGAEYMFAVSWAFEVVVLLFIAFVGIGRCRKGGGGGWLWL